MLLAAGSDEALRRYLDQLRPAQPTPRTETDPHRLAEAIATIRTAGFAQTIDQAAEGVTGTAAALRDAAGRIIGALIVAAPSSRLKDQRAELARLVMEVAATISRNLGYRSSGQTVLRAV